jgi:hypothetical protein
MIHLPQLHIGIVMSKSYATGEQQEIDAKPIGISQMPSRLARGRTEIAEARP